MGSALECPNVWNRSCLAQRFHKVHTLAEVSIQPRKHREEPALKPYLHTASAVQQTGFAHNTSQGDALPHDAH